MDDIIAITTPNCFDFTQITHSLLKSKIQSNLYHTYSASQDYYYKKLMNSIINSKSSKTLILFEDCQIFAQDIECLSCYQNFIDSQNKMKQYKRMKSNYQYPKFFGKQVQKYYQKWTSRKNQLQIKINMVNKVSLPTKKSNISDVSGISIVRVQKFEKVLDNISYYNPQSNKYYLFRRSMKQYEKTRDDVDPENSLIDLNKMLKKILIENSYIQNISTLSQNKELYDQQIHIKNKNIVTDPNLHSTIKPKTEYRLSLPHSKKISLHQQQNKFTIKTKKLGQLNKVNQKKSDNQKQGFQQLKFGSLPNLSSYKNFGHKRQKTSYKNLQDDQNDEKEIQRKKKMFEKKFEKNLQIIKAYQTENIYKAIQKSSNQYTIKKKTIINSKKFTELQNTEHYRMTQLLNKKLYKK